MTMNNQLNGYNWDVSVDSGYPKLCPDIPMSSNKEVDFEMLKIRINTTQTTMDLILFLVNS